MKKEEHKPYVPANKDIPEFTLTSVIMGALLAIIFGAANAYLGLRVGMTVSASIPAAVVSMGVIRVLLKRDSILESNMVQTIGSAGESLAAGAIFTIPVLFFWANEGKMDIPNMLTITMIALCGGVLGILFMVPLRRALIVKEHGVLPYPEGTACADVLLAGEEKGGSANKVFAGMGIAAIFKFLVDGLKVVAGTVTIPIRALKTELSTEIYPALLGVGYICGPKIASYMLAGGVIGWFVLIPAIATFGAETILYPGTEIISKMYETGGASLIWKSYIRYIGAGAVAAGGLISLIKSSPLIATTFLEAIKGIKSEKAENTLRTERDLSIRTILLWILIMILAIWLLPQLPVSLFGALLVVVFGFFFATVSSRMVGLVGSSNNPISGMTIATLLFAALCLKAVGDIGIHGMVGAIAISSVICIVAAMAGDVSQDLKTGFLLGATPKRQQIGELIGVLISSLTIGSVMILFNSAWGFGSTELSAPQATLMKMIIEGVMNNNLPWALVFIGIFIAIAIEILGIPVLPVAIGLYLPLELSTAIMIGGLIRLLADKRGGGEKEESSSGVLFCSGLIAGEGLVGILLAILAVVNVADWFDISATIQMGIWGSAVFLAVLILCIGKAALKKE